MDQLKNQVESEGGQFLRTNKVAAGLSALTSDSDNKDNTGNKYYSLELQEMELMEQRPNEGIKGQPEGVKLNNSINSPTVTNLLQGVEKSNSHPPCLLRRASCCWFLTFNEEVSSNADKFKNEQLKYADKNKALDWIDSAPSEGEQSVSKQKLVAKIIQEHANSSHLDKNNSDNADVNFSILGEKGAASLDKAEEATTRLDNLRVAKEMKVNQAQPVIDQINNAAGYQDDIVFMDGSEVIKDLEKRKVVTNNIADIADNNWNAVTIKGKIYLNPRITTNLKLLQQVLDTVPNESVKKLILATLNNIIDLKTLQDAIDTNNQRHSDLRGQQSAQKGQRKSDSNGSHGSGLDTRATGDVLPGGERVGQEQANFTRQKEVNEQFNQELQQQIDGTLPKGHVYKLGMPSESLLASGLNNLPIEMPASRLEIKSSSNNRRNLINSIISLYPKQSSVRIAKLFNAENLPEIGRKLTLWVDKEKASKWLSDHSSNVNAAGLSSKRTSKIIQEFENPTLPEKIVEIRIS